MLTNELAGRSTVSIDLEECLKRNEKGDAELFVNMFGHIMRYDHSSNGWYQWHRHYWEPDRTREAHELVMNRVAAVYQQRGEELIEHGDEEAQALGKSYCERARALRTRKRAENVLYIAASNPAVALTGDEWDRSPDLLAVNNGVIDLRTGLLEDGRQTDYIRRHVHVDWKGLECPCPILDKIIRGNLQSG